MLVCIIFYPQTRMHSTVYAVAQCLPVGHMLVLCRKDCTDRADFQHRGYIQRFAYLKK